LTDQLYRIRGRVIDQQALDTIRGIISAHWDLGRSAISRILCERWNWYQANDRLSALSQTIPCPAGCGSGQ